MNNTATPTGYCPSCQYPIDPGICPECGRTVHPHELQVQPKGPWLGRNKRKLLGALSILLLAGAFYSYHHVRWISLIPSNWLLRFDEGQKNAVSMELLQRSAWGKLSRDQLASFILRHSRMEVAPTSLTDHHLEYCVSYPRSLTGNIPRDESWWLKSIAVDGVTKDINSRLGNSLVNNFLPTDPIGQWDGLASLPPPGLGNTVSKTALDHSLSPGPHRINLKYRLSISFLNDGPGVQPISEDRSITCDFKITSDGSIVH